MGQCPPRVCEDGNTPDEMGQCPSSPPEPVSCEDGSTPDEMSQCPPIEPTTICDDGSTVQYHRPIPMVMVFLIIWITVVQYLILTSSAPDG
ncbi:MAG: hypothetical protein WBX01_04995 [Nitrososphaeraceae archaeon]